MNGRHAVRKSNGYSNGSTSIAEPTRRMHTRSVYVTRRDSKEGRQHLFGQGNCLLGCSCDLNGEGGCLTNLRELCQWRNIRKLVPLLLLVLILYAFGKEFQLLEKHYDEARAVYSDKNKTKSKTLAKNPVSKKSPTTTTESTIKPIEPEVQRTTQQNSRVAAANEVQENLGAANVTIVATEGGADASTSIEDELNDLSSNITEIHIIPKDLNAKSPFVTSRKVVNQTEIIERIRLEREELRAKLAAQEKAALEYEMEQTAKQPKLYTYMLSSGFAFRLVILKWDTNGNLIRTSPVDIPDWFSDETLPYFRKVAPSKYGRVAMLLNTNILQSVTWKLPPPIPLLSYSLPTIFDVYNSTNGQNYFILPTPYETKEYAHYIVEVARNALRPVNQRVRKILWRGTAHHIKNRIALSELQSEQDPKRIWLDVADISVDSKTKLDREVMANYYYQLDIAGESGTTWNGLRWKMCSGNVVFKVEGWGREWWYQNLVPWKHYIPVMEDLSDIYERYQWAESHPEESKQIAEAGQKVCLDTLGTKIVNEYHRFVVQSIPPATEEMIYEVDLVLDAEQNSMVNFWKRVSPDTAYDARDSFPTTETTPALNNNNNNNNNDNKKPMRQ